MTQGIAFEIEMDTPYEDAIEKVTQALKVEGFGVLTQIDVKATMKAKLGVDFRPYMIIGACNPPLAHKALSKDASVGLMLPCNVTVEATPAGGSIVRIANPEVMITFGEFAQDPVLAEVASEAKARLARVRDAL